jgi:hypothetical protein
MVISYNPLDATSFKDINEKIEGVGAEWIQPHLDITVIDSICMISDPQHHHLKLTSLLDMAYVCDHQDYIRPHCEHSKIAGTGSVLRTTCASTRGRVVHPGTSGGTGYLP